MIFTRHFFIEGSFLGSAKVGAYYPRNCDRLCPPQGNSFFCPACGRLWAECPVEGQLGMVWNVCCMNHKPGERLFGFGDRQTGGYFVPQHSPIGSIYLSWEEAFVKSFPPKVIEWELGRALQWVASADEPKVASAARDLLSSLLTRQP